MLGSSTVLPTLARILPTGWFLFVLGCAVDGECDAAKWDNQCVTLEALGLLSHVGMSAAALSDTGGLACPSFGELQYQDVRPGDLNLVGDHFTAGPEAGRSDGLCCYQTSYYCE